MMQFATTLRFSLLPLLLGACSSEVAGPGQDPIPADPEPTGTGGKADAKPSTLTERLQAGAEVELLPAGAEVAVDARSARQTSGLRVELPLRRGHARLWAEPDNRRLVIESLVADLEDVEISEEALPPDGIRLTDIRVQLAEPMEAAIEWSDGEALYSEMHLDLLIDWSFIGSDGTSYPLARQHVGDVTVSVDVFEGSDGMLHIDLAGAAPGTLRRWGGLGEIGNLELALPGLGRLEPAGSHREPVLLD